MYSDNWTTHRSTMHAQYLSYGMLETLGTKTETSTGQ